MSVIRKLEISLAALLTVSACGEAHPDFEIVARYPHDPQAYTQGLEMRGNTVFESTGQHGRSSIRKLPLDGGSVVRHDLPAEFFAEGMTLVGDRAFQLTWRQGTAFVYDTMTLTPRRKIRYEGEGWGLCFDGESIFMSDGSDSLTVRDPLSFDVTGRRGITLDGAPLMRINELECVGDFIFANVYMSNWIVQIDKKTGRVVAEFDLSILAREGQPGLNVEAVLNGIAFDSGTGTFLVTGKLWPTLYRIRLSGVP